MASKCTRHAYEASTDGEFKKCKFCGAVVDLLPDMAFLIPSTETEIELVECKRRVNGKLLSRSIYTFKYVKLPDAKHPSVNPETKPNFSTYREEIDRSVELQIWRPISKSID